MAAGRSSVRHPMSLVSAAVPKCKHVPGSIWTDMETARLIDAYEDQWYSNKRGTLKAQQWEEVSAEVAARCGLAHPSKNATQCRHKIEKLRRRYRSECLLPVPSSWSFFGRIDSMERGPFPISVRPAPPAPAFYDDDEDFGERDGSNSRRNNGIIREVPPWDNAKGPRNFMSRKRSAADEAADEQDCGKDNRQDAEELGNGGGLADLAAQMRRFGESYVRTERMRMGMMREMEREWMVMEARKLEMLMEAQRSFMETIAKAISKNAGKMKYL